MSIVVAGMSTNATVAGQAKSKRQAPLPKWVTANEYARMYSLSPITLGNWRYQDRQAGRKQALPGYPTYRYFGAAVRYLVD